MKRSDAIHELIAELDKWGCLPKEESAPGDSGYVANNILCKLEELGMQPPAVKEPCETFVLHNGQYIKTEDSFMFTHKWDQE